MSHEQWHLDKRVPIALIFAIMIQSAGGVWWASAMNERMAQVERRIEGFASRNAQTDERVNTQAQEIAVLASEIKQIGRQLDRLYAQGEATNQLLRQMITGNGGR